MKGNDKKNGKTGKESEKEGKKKGKKGKGEKYESHTFVFPTVSNKSKTCNVIPKLTKFLNKVIHKNASTAISKCASTIYVPVAVAPMMSAKVTKAKRRMEM